MSDVKKEKELEEENLTQAEEVPETEDGEREAAVDVETEKEGEGEKKEEDEGKEEEAEPKDKEKRRFQAPAFFSKFKKPTFRTTRRPTMDSFYCPEDRAQFRSTMGATFGGIYAISLVVLGIALPAGFFLSTNVIDEGIVLAVYHMYLYVLAIIFLLYVQITMMVKKRRWEKASWPELEMKSSPTMLTNADREQQEDNPSTSKTADEASALTPEIEVKREEPEPLMFSHSSEGVNFYLRLGAIGFALGMMIQDCLFILQFLVGPNSLWNCYGVPFILVMIFRLVFTIIQTYFIFKNHQLVLGFQKCWMKLGLLHVIATNLSIWAITVILEATESVITAGHGPNLTSIPLLNRERRQADNATVTSGNATVAPESSDPAVTSYPWTSHMCMKEQTIGNQTAPYLFPFTIEYALICAAILYKIYINVGAEVSHKVVESTHLFDEESDGGECHKSNTGLFVGIVVFMLTLVSTCMFLIYADDMEHKTAIIYLSSDIILNFLALIIVCLAQCRTRRLRLQEPKTKFDQNLLLIALAGYYFLVVFVLLPSFANVTSDPPTGLFAKLQITSKVLTFFQITIQVLFIIDGLRRRATTRNQLIRKPGRSLVTLLLIINLAMWVINTFQMKHMSSAPSMQEFYGVDAWILMVYLSLPLAIFFRFHSSICLSDIWIITYRPDSRSVQQLCVQQTEHNII